MTFEDKIKADAEKIKAEIEKLGGGDISYIYGFDLYGLNCLDHNSEASYFKNTKYTEKLFKNHGLDVRHFDTSFATILRFTERKVK